jgi:hypothetical protein
MVGDRHRVCGGLSAAALAVTSIVSSAFLQPEPVASMFRADMKRDQTLAASFVPLEVPAGAAKSAIQVYLTAGDLERAFDNAQFRPDAAIVPTNTELEVTAASPATQRVLIARVMKQPAVMADLQDQIAARRKQSPGPVGGAGILQIGIDSFVARLPRSGPADAKAAFPHHACLIATDFPTGGAIDRRDLFAQDRVRQGVARCLTALDAAGAGSVVMPLLGAASAQTQTQDPVYEGQRLLKECRHINAVAGIALGIRDFAPNRRTVREIGIVQWDREISEMFGTSSAGQAAYRLYAEQIKRAATKGLAGDNTTAADLDGNCAATLNAGTGI